MLAVYVAYINATELTFELADNEKQCFYEDLEQGEKFDIDFQVIVLRMQLFSNAKYLAAYLEGFHRSYTSDSLAEFV